MTPELPIDEGRRGTSVGCAGAWMKYRNALCLRNLSRGRGVGFFEAGNFHPDFILWLLVGDRQQVMFVDPKGIRQVGVDDPKVHFYKTVKEIEARLGEPNIALNSFLISKTPSHEMEKQWGIDKTAMLKRNILFQKEDKELYVRTMLQGVGESPTQ